MTLPKIAVLGTGMVGHTLAARLGQLGYETRVGARSAESASLEPFGELSGVGTGDFATVAAWADVVINATNGSHSIEALTAAGAENLAGKVVVDVSNDLEPVEGGFPRPRATAENCLGLRIQQQFPEARVVKSLNTMNCKVMADPSLVGGDHVVFLSGNDAHAKDEFKAVLVSFGWRTTQMIDLGGIETAAGPEMMMPVWMAVTIARGFEGPPFNWAINTG